MARYFVLALAIIGCGLTTAEDDLPNLGIVGGRRVDIGQLPYQVSLARFGRHFCGGSIIGPQAILTAAHCTDKQSASQLSVRAGSSQHGYGGQSVGVARIIQHRYYTKANIDNDISILILEKPLQFNSKVKPVALASRIPYGSMAAVSGWGAMGEGQRASSDLQMVGANVFKREMCNQIYGRRLTSNMFCAGYIEPGKDSCQGDSGGPLVANNQLIGVVSWGIGCARARLPGIYTVVPNYLDWIRENAGI